MLSNAIEQAQKTVESRNFQTRKNVLEFDDVMNQQRNLIYDERRQVLEGEDMRENRSGHAGGVHQAPPSHPGLRNGASARPRSSWTRRCPPLTAVLPKGMLKLETFGGKADAEKIAAAVLPDRRTGLRRPREGLRRRSQRQLPSCASWSASSCCAWWTNTGWITSTPWTI
jgi:hypothetical protein